MSLFEPYPRSRLERVAEIRPPLWPWATHYARQLRKLPDHYRISLKFVLRWSGYGVAGIFAAVLATMTGEGCHGRTLNKAAVKVRDDHQAAIAADQKRQQEAEEERIATLNAVSNWERWQNTFINAYDERLCYHAHFFNTPTKVYEITCYVGDKGRTPNSTVICNQSACSVSPYIAPRR